MKAPLISTLVLCAAPAWAELERLPDFATCMNGEIARYERALRRHLDGPKAEQFDIGNVIGVDYCGSVGIVNCDRSGDTIPCQKALAVTQDALSTRVRATVPEAEAVMGRNGEWSDTLYPLLWNLAHGSSAGPDCTGAPEIMEAWCEAREANRRLADAVLLWQLARFLDAAPRATEAGWADQPPPKRPQARPDETEQ